MCGDALAMMGDDKRLGLFRPDLDAPSDSGFRNVSATH
jgi:hypothetical protein